MRPKSFRTARRMLAGLGVLCLAACGDGVVCIEGVPCGPVPNYFEPDPAPGQTALRFAAAGPGDWHACMLDGAGAAWCWGSNEYGQLGAATLQRCMDGNVDCSSVPLRVGGTQVFTALAPGHPQTCALAANGTAWCWGHGPQLGDGQRVDRTAPVAVAGGQRWQVIAAGGSVTCGITTAGAAWCWGWNEVGATGRPIVAY